jgi:membrane protein DedA with SNARE-associated domain
MELSFIPDFSNIGGWFYFFIIVLLLSATPIPLFATEVIVAAAGALANPLLVGIVAGIAAAIGELTTYFIGLGGEKVISKKKKEGRHYKRATELFDKWGFGAVVIFAFTPLPMDLIGLIAGGLKYDVRRFFAAALIGKIPRNILVAYIGAIGAQLIF